jgi:hypothetical protein
MATDAGEGYTPAISKVEMFGLLLFVSSISLAKLRCWLSKTFYIADKDDSSVLARSEGVSDAGNERKSVVVVTRIHGASSSSFPSSHAVVDFVQRVVSARVAESELRILIILGNDKSLSDLNAVNEQYHAAIQALHLDVSVTVYPVFPWGYFTIPLNYALLFAQDKASDVIIFQVSILFVFISSAY